MSTEVVFNWNPNFDRFVASAVANGLNAAATVAQTDLKRAFVVRNGPGFGTKVPPKRGRKGRGPGGFVSAPFGLPTYQTGDTSRSIQVWQHANPGRLAAVVGSRTKVAGWLETGTSRMAPRPWVSITKKVCSPKWRYAFFEAARRSMRAGVAA